MSLTTWVESTVRNVCTVGHIGHRVTTTSVGQKSVVTWEHDGRTVLLGESTMLGRKRALYEVLSNPSIIVKIKALESEARKQKMLREIAAVDAEVAFVL